MKTGFIIINYNDVKTTLKLLKNIEKYQCLDHIVIVDNCSTDHSFETLKKEKSKKVSVIQNSSRSYGSGINFGSKFLIEKYQKCYIVVANPDIIIDKEQDIEKLLSCFDKNTAIVAPVIFEHGQLNRGWRLTSFFTDWICLFPKIDTIVKKKKMYYEENHYRTKTSIVDVVSGCFFIIDSQALEKADFFDEKVFLYYEEAIIAKKIERLGMKEIINNEVTVIHDHSVTIDKALNKIKKYKALRKSQQYYEIHYNHANWFQRQLFSVTISCSGFLFGLYYKLKERKINS